MNSEQEGMNQLLVDISNAQNHPKIRIDIELIPRHYLNDFIVKEGVLNPDIVTSRYLASYLFCNNGKYKEKSLWDMGCGSGIQGVVASLNGAKKVIFSDNNIKAVQNTRENVRNLKINNKSEVYHCDLFGKSTEIVDIIIFNHPFFSTQIDNFKGMVVDNGKLIQRFLSKASVHLRKDGFVIMPFCHAAGPINNPKILGPKWGYTVNEVFTTTSTLRLNPGKISIYELKR